jgi:CD109 antigen
MFGSKCLEQNADNRQYVENQALFYRKKIVSILIQTDKPIYKPGDLLKFRLFSISSETLPVNLTNVVVAILDSAGVKIRYFSNAVLRKGLFEESVQVSMDPPFGKWTIQVDYDGEIYEKTVEVQDYIPPAVSVKLEAPRYVPFIETT